MNRRENIWVEGEEKPEAEPVAGIEDFPAIGLPQEVLLRETCHRQEGGTGLHKVRRQDHPVVRRQDHPVAHRQDHPVAHRQDHPGTHRQDHPGTNRQGHPGVHPRQDHPMAVPGVFLVIQDLMEREVLREQEDVDVVWC